MAFGQKGRFAFLSTEACRIELHDIYDGKRGFDAFFDQRYVHRRGFSHNYVLFYGAAHNCRLDHKRLPTGLYRYDAHNRQGKRRVQQKVYLYSLSGAVHRLSLIHI